MATNETAISAALVSDNEKEIVPEWLELQKRAGALQTGRITEAELLAQSREFLHLLRERTWPKAAAMSRNAAYAPAREFLASLSRSRAQQGFSPSRNCDLRLLA